MDRVPVEADSSRWGPPPRFIRDSEGGLIGFHKPRQWGLICDRDLEIQDITVDPLSEVLRLVRIKVMEGGGLHEHGRHGFIGHRAG
jgi:hypothetical protein